MEKKICSKCKIEKDVCEFHKHSPSKNGVRGVCKECRKLEKHKNYEYRLINKEKIRIKNKKWLEENPNYNKEYSKIYNVKNREKLNLKLKKWRETNKTLHRVKNQIKRNEKYNNDIFFRLKHLLRCRLNKIINFKRNKSSIDILGCSIEVLISHLESQFKDGMSWDNYGYYGWHIDHIIPVSTAKTEDEIYKLFHYTNLQPLWSKDNLKKSNKIIKN
jgi:hypothetical protein